jgi:cell division transport system ATP-binding protein
MLSFNDVSFGYDNHSVLKEINFSIQEGEFCFLIGKSGCGKSTLLQLIYMNIFPTSGYVNFWDFCSSSIRTTQLHHLRKKIGIIFQEFRLLKDRNLYENLSFILEVTDNKNSEVKRKIARALNEVGLAHKVLSYPNNLSGGEQQRAAIARAIINDPSLILADEPTGNLDPETSFEILETLIKINRKGTSILLATHNYDLIKKFNTRILKLENGKIREIAKNELN